MLKTPVALFIWRRPEETQRVFARIAEAKPATLLIVADGPRTPEDAEGCAAARAVTEQIDWPCEVLRNYADENLGCRGRMSTGIDWVFEQVEEAILLEDDCVPHPTFFRFCAEMLARYREDERVMAVHGTSYAPLDADFEASYHFTRYPNMWGWATWRRAWAHYDVAMTGWDEEDIRRLLFEVWGDERLVTYWYDVLARTHEGEIDTWDYQWLLSFWRQDGLAVTPNTNLITNVGFNEMATHTTSVTPYAEMPITAMRFPLVHPAEVTHDEENSRHYYEVWARKAHKRYPVQTPVTRVMALLKRGMRKILSA